MLLCSAAAEDPNAPHVMISYHWAAQKTMILVKERLKAEGFKVWMDIDNMSKTLVKLVRMVVMSWIYMVKPVMGLGLNGNKYLRIASAHSGLTFSHLFLEQNQS